MQFDDGIASLNHYEDFGVDATCPMNLRTAIAFGKSCAAPSPCPFPPMGERVISKASFRAQCAKLPSGEFSPCPSMRFPLCLKSFQLEVSIYLAVPAAFPESPPDFFARSCFASQSLNALATS